MLARAVASESRANFLALTSATLESKWFGESAKLIQAAFELARGELEPCIVFFDEIDGLGRSRTEQDQSSVYSFKCELLRNMDEISGATAVSVVACTNCPDALDPALKRRFPCVLRVDKPTLEERRSILRVLDPEGDPAVLARVAEASEGKTGAELTTMHRAACHNRLWARKRRDGTPWLEEALARQVVRDGRHLLSHLPRLTVSDWAVVGGKP